MEEALQAAKLKSIARKIMFSSKSSLIVHLRFLDYAINKLRLEEYDEYACVDGRVIKYNPMYILQCYSEDKNLVTRLYLHMILHCTFMHFYVSARIDHDLWDIACDIAVENILDQLSETEDYLAVTHDEQREKTMAHIRENVDKLTAEKIYRYLLDNRPTEDELESLYSGFLADDHACWYEDTGKKEELKAQEDDPEQEEKQDTDGGNFSQNDDENDESGDEKTQGQSSQTPNKEDDGESEAKQTPDNENQRDNTEKQQDENQDGENQEGEQSEDGQQQQMDRQKQQTMDEWEEVAKHMDIDLETFSKEKGSRVGDLLLNIKNVTREKYDYTAFLRKFSAMGEKVKLNDDEFDYVYYTYGLRLYDNMPLVEPLEYKETHVVKEFVIAIDTSFSVHGEEVQGFVRKTYNILKAAESFSSKINLHIIQCDTKVQHDEKITTQAELDKYMKDMLLFGFGGTDFRPVFEYVDRLIENKEFTDLKGLIYFTDGFGTFPERPRPYKTAFAFVSDDPTFDPTVPPWAVKLIIDPEDIKQDNL